ncbi:uncharacterized protein LOC134760462 isoform X4 [Pongo abelii]|uniref:uncharacterized protein LOC134760462 isoform X4 n=1 Tax=Pongo abelii TaxID=9601 RepID=UPI003007A6D3
MSQKSTQQILPQGEVGCLLEMQPKFLQFVSLQALSSVFPHNEGDCRKDLDKLPIHFPTPHPRYFSVRQELLALTRLSTYLSLEHEGHWCIHEHAWIKCKQLNCVSRIESRQSCLKSDLPLIFQQRVESAVLPGENSPAWRSHF